MLQALSQLKKTSISCSALLYFLVCSSLVLHVGSSCLGAFAYTESRRLFRNIWTPPWNSNGSIAEANSGLEAECWDTWNMSELDPSMRRVFHLHISKVAGCSFVNDAATVIDQKNATAGRQHIWSNEACYRMNEAVPGVNFTSVMLRDPRKHVVSMYEHCKNGGGPGWYETLHAINAAPGDSNFTLPSFADWVHAWKEEPTAGMITTSTDKFHCYRPISLQSHQLTCEDGTVYSNESLFPFALAILARTDMVGILEAYHESICLFAVKVRGDLPHHCNCEDPEAWNSFNSTHYSHGYQYQDPELYYQDPSVKADLDWITKDDRIAYKASVKRFKKEIRSVEREFRTRILCRDLEVDESHANLQAIPLLIVAFQVGFAYMDWLMSRS